MHVRHFLLVAGMFFLMVLMASLSQAASIEIIQRGVSGSITSDIGLESLNESAESEDDIFFGTQLGVYVFSSEGTLTNFIQTGSSVTNIESIPDIDDNGYNELVITTTNNYFPNVLCFDSLTGDKLWEFSSETEVFDVDMLWTMKQVTAYELEVSQSGDNIYLTAGYNVFRLGTQTGNKLSSFEGTDNMWDISLVDGDVVVGDQNGYVYRLNGESLGVIWKKFVSKSYTVVNPSTKGAMGTVKRSVWDIVPITVNDKSLVAVCTEDGYLYILDFDTGEILRSTEIIDYVDELLYAYYGDYPLPTSFVGYNFFNIRAKVIPDVTEDNNQEILVYTYPGTRIGHEYQGARKGIYIVDPTTGEIVSENENFDLSKINRLETIISQDLENKTYIILPTGKSGSQEKIKLIDPEDCTTYDTISINSTSGSSSSNIYSIKVLDEDYFLLCSNYGDVLKSDLNGNVSWNYPRLNNIKVERVDLVGNSDLDLLVLSDEGMDEDDFLSVSSSRTIYVTDGETKEIAWSYEMPYNEFIQSGGLLAVKAVDDLNGDGKKDIVAYKQRYAEWGSGDEYGEYTRIIVFSGKGEILYEKSLTDSTFYGVYEQLYNDSSYLASLDPGQLENINDRRIRKIIVSLDTIADVSGDGISDFIVGSWNDVYILNSSNGEIIWTRTYNSWLYEQPSGYNPMAIYEWDWLSDDRMRYLSLGDQNSDGYDELLQISWNEMWILHSKVTSGILDYTPYKQITYEGNFEKEKVKIVKDLNGDSYSDIVFLLHIEDSPAMYKIISGTSGSEIMEFEREGTTFELGAADFNDDGYEDSIVFYAWGSSGPRLEILSGKTSEVIWSYLRYDETWMLRDIYGIQKIMPVCYVDDFNGDGSNDLALGRSLPWTTGAEVLIYDVKNNGLLKTITVESIGQDSNDRRWQPSIITAPLSDLTGDGIGEVAVVMALGKGNQKQLKLVILDIAEEEIISDFIAKGTEIEDVGDLIATYGSGGELYLLNPEKDLSIVSPQDYQIVTSPMKISWSENNNDTVKIIMVDNNRIMKATGKNAEFDLKQGNRKITIYSFDEYGKGLYETVTVNVEKTSAAATPLTILLVILLIVLFVPKSLPVILKKHLFRKNKERSKKEDEE